MQDDPLNDELDESQSESSDVDDNDATAVGRNISGEDAVIMDGGLSLERGLNISIDIDQVLFLNDGEEDPDPPIRIGTAKDFELKDFELDAELEDDIEDAFFPNKEFDLDAEPKEIDPDLEGSSQDELEDKEHLMPFFSLFACFILMVICAGFLISMFLGDV